MSDREDLRKFITDLAVVHGRVILSSGAEADYYLDLRRIAVPVLRRLQAETDETTTVSALIGDARVYLAQVVSRQQQQDIGHPCGALRARPRHLGPGERLYCPGRRNLSSVVPASWRLTVRRFARSGQ